jgi:hypothetical protein
MFYTNLPEDQDLGELANRRQIMVECLGEKCGWWNDPTGQCAIFVLAVDIGLSIAKRDRAVDGYEDSH